jgi:flavin reductase (DIM6/NTAB) family NADH-FMN oxidoreductase RutF
VTIHSGHPFQPPESERDPVRRLRGRLPAPVTLWTAAHGGDRAGLTVSSLLVAAGEPAHVVGVLDPLSELWTTLRQARQAVVSVLAWPDRQLAEAFGYRAPAPGGPFAMASWQDTAWGPRLASTGAWAGCRLAEGQPEQLGWGLLVRLVIEHAELGDDPAPLVHRRGAYHTF